MYISINFDVGKSNKSKNVKAEETNLVTNMLFVLAVLVFEHMYVSLSVTYF